MLFRYYSDIESRLKTLRMEQERLWELLAKADTTEAIILLEKRLTEVSSEIESSESRMRYLDNSVTYSTVNLSIDEVDIESPTQPETAWQQIQRGFTRNLISLMDNLTRFFISLLSFVPEITENTPIPNVHTNAPTTHIDTIFSLFFLPLTFILTSISAFLAS